MYRTILAALAVAMTMAFGLGASSAAHAGGLASFYGYDFAGKPTANGETFNPGALTAASLSLPFGTMVRVTNRNNGRSVVVRINDRGPYVGGRVIDLSLAAAGAIGMVGSGVAPVDISVVGSGSRTIVASNTGRRHGGSVQVAARTHRHHAAVQVAFVGSRHRHHHGIMVASLGHHHRHTGTAIATGVSTNAEGFTGDASSN